MIFFRRNKNGTFYDLIDKSIANINLYFKNINNPRLKREILFPLLEIRWTKNYMEEAERINRALESKGEKIRKAREQYKNELLTLERGKKDTSLIKAKLEILDILMEGIE